MSKYDDYIDQAAEKYGIRKDIAHRLVKNESDGNQNAISPAGAIGITQLMPRTAKELGVDPTDPYQNIDGGIRYLSQGLKKFKGDYSQALAGYNAGPNHDAVVNKDWSKLPKETKNYVNKFMDLIIKPANADETPYMKKTADIPEIQGIPVSSSDTQQPTTDIPEIQGIPVSGHSNTSNGLEWSDVPGNAILNIPKDARDVATGIKKMMTSKETLPTIGDIAGGYLGKILPDALRTTNPERDARQENAANAFTQNLKDRYGSEDAWKHSIADHPVSTALDLSALLTGGGSAVSKLPITGAKTVGKVMQAADPVMLTGKTAVGAVTGTGNLVNRLIPEQIGNLGTRTGPESLKVAHDAGLKGGSQSEAFTKNLREPTENMVDTEKGLVESARKAAENMRVARIKEYNSGMVDISKDKEILPFYNIKSTVTDILNAGKYKGKIINPSTTDTAEGISNLINDWATSDSAKFHTPEGLDKLKQAIGDIRQGTDYGSASRNVANKAYNAIKNEIATHAPAYAKVMEDYSNASDMIQEIEKGLSLGDAGKTTVHQTLKKLQNTATSGDKKIPQSLVKELEKHGADNLSYKIMGNAMNSYTPKNAISNGVGLGSIGAALYTANPAPLLIPAMQSPRLMGEAAHALGATKRVLTPSFEFMKKSGPVVNTITKPEPPPEPIITHPIQGVNSLPNLNGAKGVTKWQAPVKQNGISITGQHSLEGVNSGQLNPVVSAKPMVKNNGISFTGKADLKGVNSLENPNASIIQPKVNPTVDKIINKKIKEAVVKPVKEPVAKPTKTAQPKVDPVKTVLKNDVSKVVKENAPVKNGTPFQMIHQLVSDSTTNLHDPKIQDHIRNNLMLMDPKEQQIIKDMANKRVAAPTQKIPDEPNTRSYISNRPKKSLWDSVAQSTNKVGQRVNESIETAKTKQLGKMVQENLKKSTLDIPDKPRFTTDGKGRSQLQDHSIISDKMEGALGGIRHYEGEVEKIRKLKNRSETQNTTLINYQNKINGLYKSHRSLQQQLHDLEDAMDPRILRFTYKG